MIIQKITIGFVMQTFDTDKGRWTCQDFICGDDVSWEDVNGEPLDAPEDTAAYNNYLPFEMEQPK